MVQRIINLLNKELNSIAQAAFLLAGFTILSQVLGLLRDRSFTHFLGASSGLDIYYAAFRVPDFIYFSVASLVSITVLIPFLVKKIDQSDNYQESRKFFNDVFTVFLIAMIGISVLTFFLMPVLAPLIAPGFSETAQKELINLARIMLLSPIFLGLSNLIGSITQLFKRFIVFALSPIFYNLGILAGVFFLYPKLGLTGLAIGVVFGALMHFLIQLPVVALHKFIPKFSFSIDFGQIKKVALLSLPRTITLSLQSFSLIIIMAMASLIKEGSVSVFNLSLHLQTAPLAIIGMSYSVAAFPALTQFFSKDNQEAFIHHLTITARQIIFWSMPVVFLFIVLRAQIVRVILGSGEFSWADTRLTAAALAIFSISVIAQSLRLLFIKSYYATGITKRPLVISLISTSIIIILAYCLLQIFNQNEFFRHFIESLLRVEDISGTAVLMLPLAFSIGAIVDILLLLFFLKKDLLKNLTIPFINKAFFQSFSSSFLIGFTAYHFLEIFDNVFDLNTFWGIFFQGFLSGLIGIIMGILLLWLMKNEELINISKTLKTKFWKARVISPGQEDL